MPILQSNNPQHNISSHEVLVERKFQCENGQEFDIRIQDSRTERTQNIAFLISSKLEDEEKPSKCIRLIIIMLSHQCTI